MLTLVKWIKNPDENSTNTMITRTLGKIGIMTAKALLESKVLPKHDEFWYSEIVLETKPGSQGCFVLRPIKRVTYVSYKGRRRPDFTYLIPGACEYVRRRNALLVYPHKKGAHWICSASVRKYLLNAHREGDGDYSVNAVIVVFDNTEEWTTLDPTKRKEKTRASEE